MSAKGLRRVPQFDELVGVRFRFKIPKFPARDLVRSQAFDVFNQAELLAQNGAQMDHARLEHDLVQAANASGVSVAEVRSAMESAPTPATSVVAMTQAASAEANRQAELMQAFGSAREIVAAIRSNIQSQIVGPASIPVSITYSPSAIRQELLPMINQMFRTYGREISFNTLRQAGLFQIRGIEDLLRRIESGPSAASSDTPIIIPASSTRRLLPPPPPPTDLPQLPPPPPKAPSPLVGGVMLGTPKDQPAASGVTARSKARSLALTPERGGNLPRKARKTD